MMNFQTITFEKEEHIATLTLNRPDRMNALNEQMIGEILMALDEASRDPEIRVLVLTGAGRAFCAGADLRGDEGGERVLSETHPEMTRQGLRYGAQQVVQRLQGLDIPTIGMVNGAAVGAGFDWALACDLRIGSENARFMVAFTRVGLIPGTGGMWLMSRIMGLPKAAELAFTGDFLEAPEAKEVGALNRLVPAAELKKETMKLAHRIANNPPIAIRLNKMLLYEGLKTDLKTALELAAATQSIALASEDHKEGVAAFREKRAPSYKGR